MPLYLGNTGKLVACDLLPFESVDNAVILPNTDFTIPENQQKIIAFFGNKINKRFFNRETITALNYEVYTKFISYPTPFYVIQIISPFLISMISANHDKMDGLSAISW